MCTLRGHRYKFPNYDVFLSLAQVVLVLANSADPMECSTMHLGVSSIQRVNIRIKIRSDEHLDASYLHVPFWLETQRRLVFIVSIHSYGYSCADWH